MVRPFWVINSALLFLCMCAVLLVYLMRITIPEREDIEPVLYSTQKKEQNMAINIRHIYENDLFGTYQKEVVKQNAPEQVEPVPQGPIPQRIFIPEPPKPAFLEPLNITLRGIVVVSADESKNSALIADNKTDQEGTYKVTDTVQDAQLIRIFNNKIILLRNNGQQEVLYLREHDAKTDPSFMQIEQWNTTVTRDDNMNFTIFPAAFIKRVENLPRFIELLCLTTAYQRGNPVGARIGDISQQSLGIYLGFLPGDIVLSINAISTTTLQNRVAIYNQIVSLALPARVTVTYLRGGRTMQHEYHIEQFKHEFVPIKTTVPAKEVPGAAGNVNNTESRHMHENEYDNRYTPDTFDEDMFAQVRKELRKRETTNILTHTGSGSQGEMKR
jgi:type II secretory pathway component PulC